jgi:glycosyltransferase involved in cell wall biosynthesis
VQYYPDPAQYQFAEVEGSRLVGFFWQRRDEITWRHIRALVDGTKFERLLLHLAPDPGFRAESPSRSDLDTHSISVSTWFRDQSDYAVLCARANVYFAPRIREGIGMSFLEAMARGNCVVAADQPTMNEYIRHGENGLLFDPRCPEPLDFSCAKELGRRARSWVESGHTAWVEAQESLLEYLATPVRSLKRGPHFVMRRSLNSFHHWASRFAAGLRRSALRWLSREARNQR